MFTVRALEDGLMPAPMRDLPGGCLAGARGQDAADNRFLDARRVDTGAFDGGSRGHRAELDRRLTRQAAEKSANRRPAGRKDQGMRCGHRLPFPALGRSTIRYQPVPDQGLDVLAPGGVEAVATKDIVGTIAGRAV